VDKNIQSVKHIDTFRKLLHQTDADNPKQEEVEALRHYLVEHPEILKIGDLATLCRTQLITKFHDSVGVSEIITSYIDYVKNLLNFSKSSTLEQLVIEQILLSWLRLYILENNLVELESKGLSLPSAKKWDKRIESAQYRFLRACKSLAQIRKLTKDMPFVQVNIATEEGQQINIAGDVNRRQRLDG